MEILIVERDAGRYAFGAEEIRFVLEVGQHRIAREESDGLGKKGREFEAVGVDLRGGIVEVHAQAADELGLGDAHAGEEVQAIRGGEGIRFTCEGAGG